MTTNDSQGGGGGQRGGSVKSYTPPEGQSIVSQEGWS